MGGPTAKTRREQAAFEASLRLNAQMDEELARLQQAMASLPIDTAVPRTSPTSSLPSPAVVADKAVKLSRLLPSNSRVTHGPGEANRGGKLANGSNSSSSEHIKGPAGPLSLSPAVAPRHPPSAPPPPPPPPGRRPLPPARPIANIKAVMEEAWYMANEDMAESLRAKEWELRKARALQVMTQEYEEAKGREVEEEFGATLSGMMEGLSVGTIKAKEALVMDLQRVTTYKVRQVQEESQRRFLSEVDAIRKDAKAKAATHVQGTKDQLRQQRQVELARRREALLEERQALLRARERQLEEDSASELASLRASLQEGAAEMDLKVEETMKEHIREECERLRREGRDALEAQREEVVAAEARRLENLMLALRARLAEWRAAAEVDVRTRLQDIATATSLQTWWSEQSQAGGGSSSVRTPMGMSGDDEEAALSKSSRSKDVGRWLGGMEAWLEEGCGRLSLAVGEVGREMLLLRKKAGHAEPWEEDEDEEGTA